MSEIIAKAMNSTLGTSNFKAFDEIFMGERCLVPSENVLASFPGMSGILKNVAGSSAVAVARFSFPLDGSVNLSYKLYTKSGSNTTSGSYMYIYVGGELQTTVLDKAYSEPSGFSNVAVTFEAGQVVEIRLKPMFSTSSSSAYLQLTDVLGDVCKTKPLNVEVLI